MDSFVVKECNDTSVIKALFTEYSQIKGAESCFVSFDKEMTDLGAFYSGGSILVGYEDEYLSHDSLKFHKKEGYYKVAQMNAIGKKFDRWYDLIWMQKKINEEEE